VTAAALQRRRFVSMAVGVECLLESGSAVDTLFDDVEREFMRLEAVFSRFRPDSDLSALNRAGTRCCTPELVEVVELALAARAKTDGRFDPTVHDALLAAGYDRTFAELAPDECGPELEARPCAGEAAVDRARGVVRLGCGVRLDLGGIVKGWAAERACDFLAAAGPCLLNAGGDIACRGVPAEGVWPIAVDAPGVELTLGLRCGGVATSGRDHRRWRRNGREQHHLIDPATGLPSTSDLVTVTALGADAVDAEIRAKSLFLAGARGAVAEAERLEIPCVLVTEGGHVLKAGGLA
jgi:FAD:protein FMN transferase